METILIIDDDEEILEFLTDVLSETYHTIKATNGQKALDILEDNKVNLIISDIMMPEIDGFEFCQIVKSKISYCHIPLILLTAKNTYMAKVEGLEVGADAYIEKPFPHQYLLKQINNLLTNRAKIIDHFSSSPFEDMRIVAQSKTDEVFVKKLSDFIVQNLRFVDLGIDELAYHMNMSRPTFYRKVKSISSLSPRELINITRLKMAAGLLAKNDFKVYEVSEMVGYSSPTVFGNNFHKHFKLTPTEYIASLKK